MDLSRTKRTWHWRHFRYKVAPPTGLGSWNILRTRESTVNYSRDMEAANRDLKIAVDRSKRMVEELKIASGEELAAITTWSDKFDQDTAAVDIDMEKSQRF